MKTILYIHGMGGGEDSRIPAFLNDWFGSQRPDIRVVVRTYDFHPDQAAAQIDAWYEELRPVLVIGESLGSNHALALLQRLKVAGCGAQRRSGAEDLSPWGECSPASSAPPQPIPPLLLVSPALNAPKSLYALRGIARIPQLRKWLNHRFQPLEGRRQTIDFAPETLTAWGAYRNLGRMQEPGCPASEGAFPEGTNTPLLHTHSAPAPTPIYAFFGRRDHYRRTGVVTVKKWRRTIGPGTYAIYDGTHYMEEAYLRELLIPAILERI